MKQHFIFTAVLCVFLIQGCASWTETNESRYKWKIGMTKAQVLGSVDGSPRQVNKTTTAYGTSEIWVYAGPAFLFFDEGGILRRIDSPY